MRKCIALAVAISLASGPVLAADPACDPAVARSIVDLSTANVEGAHQVALSTYSRPEEFGRLSCIDDILNASYNILFDPNSLPSLADLFNRLINIACDKVEGVWAQATQPLNQSFYSGEMLGGFFPGVTIGGRVPSDRSTPYSTNGWGVDTTISNPGFLNDFYRLEEQRMQRLPPYMRTTAPEGVIIF